MENQDPLERLYVRPEQVEGEQRELLANLIFPYAGINPESGEVHFKPTSDDLIAKQKILVFLLCRLALSTRPNTTFTAAVSPIEIEKATMLPGGTLRPKLMELVKSRVVVKSGDGYYIHPSSLYRAKEILPIEE
jgi:hypothetical protein